MFHTNGASQAYFLLKKNKIWETCFNAIHLQYINNNTKYSWKIYGMILKNQNQSNVSLIKGILSCKIRENIEKKNSVKSLKRNMRIQCFCFLLKNNKFVGKHFSMQCIYNMNNNK